jgi:hypothetical protein
MMSAVMDASPPELRWADDQMDDATPATFNFEAAYLNQLPRLKRTEAHKLLEQIRIELVYGANVPIRLVRRPHPALMHMARTRRPG